MSNSFTELVLSSYYAELGAYARYMRMAGLAPTEEARRIVFMNAQDEFRHAEAFEQIYQELTGMQPPAGGMPLVNQEAESFTGLLRLQLADELADTAKYKNMYLMTTNPRYREILFSAAQDELRHAMLDTYLLV